MAELFEVLDSMEVRGGSAKRTSKAAAAENGAQPLRGVGACKRGRSPGETCRHRFLTKQADEARARGNVPSHEARVRMYWPTTVTRTRPVREKRQAMPCQQQLVTVVPATRRVGMIGTIPPSHLHGRCRVIAASGAGIASVCGGCASKRCARCRC